MSYKERLGMRELRQNLKAHVESGKVIEIGTSWNLRAVLVSIPSEPDRWKPKERARVLRALVAAAKKAILEENE